MSPAETTEFTAPDDKKLATLARATRARTRAAEGACVRDQDGRTYAGATVALESLRVSATGVALAIPDGWVGLVHPRSGLAARHGISIVNAPGTVDAGYRGEILVNLVNLDPQEAFTIRRGDRIAQLVLQEVARAHFLEVDSLDDTSRGDTGHGASGGFGQHTATTKD